MRDGEFPTELNARLMVSRIVWSTIVGGVVIFFAVAAYLRSTGQMGPPPDEPTLTYIVVAAALGLALGYFVLPPLMLTSARRRLAEQPGDVSLAQLYGAWQTSFIVRLALLEAAAFLAVLAYMLEGTDLARYAALGFMVTLALEFPGRIYLGRLLLEQQILLEQERQARQGL
jgi:hypothetical protein